MKTGHFLPPLVTTSLTPEEILGDLYIPFCSWIVQRETSGKDIKLKEDDAARMGHCVDQLRLHGFVVGDHKSGRRVDARGNVLFSVIIKNQTDTIFAGPELERLKKLSASEHRKIAKDFVRR